MAVFLENADARSDYRSAQRPSQGAAEQTRGERAWRRTAGDQRKLSIAGNHPRDGVGSTDRRRFLAQVAGVCRPGDPGERWLHGPGQLGNGFGSRSTVQVWAIVGGCPGEFDGDFHAGHFGQIGRGGG
jgi:hypothetical protein